jgi:hypothetical protein
MSLKRELDFKRLKQLLQEVDKQAHKTGIKTCKGQVAEDKTYII